MWLSPKTVRCRAALVCAHASFPGGVGGCLTAEAVSPADVCGAKKLDPESLWHQSASTGSEGGQEGGRAHPPPRDVEGM